MKSPFRWNKLPRSTRHHIDKLVANRRRDRVAELRRFVRNLKLEAAR